MAADRGTVSKTCRRSTSTNISLSSPSSSSSRRSINNIIFSNNNSSSYLFSRSRNKILGSSWSPLLLSLRRRRRSLNK